MHLASRKASTHKPRRQNTTRRRLDHQMIRDPKKGGGVRGLPAAPLSSKKEAQHTGEGEVKRFVPSLYIYKWGGFYLMSVVSVVSVVAVGVRLLLETDSEH